MKTEPYLDQVQRWPKTGRHILAQYDSQRVVVYQAYRPAIGRFAAEHQYFGGEFKLSRMSWIKPNFLWMMYRCGWGVKPDQEVVLAVTIRRAAFDQLLQQATHSTFVAEVYGAHETWQERLRYSDVRLQWDPDHDPHGIDQERRAIQLGMSGDVLKAYSREWIIKIEDISGFVAEQRAHLEHNNLKELLTPREEVYPVADETVVRHVGLSSPNE